MADTNEFSFANNFWGKDDTGVNNLLHRMHDAKQTCEEIHSFFKERIAIEEEYSKRMLSLSRKALGSGEMGSLRQALDVIRTNTESMGRSHNSAAQQLKKELDDPLEAFATTTRQRRKTVEGTVDKLLKAKISQNTAVEKARSKFESDCNKINGYFAQQNLLMGRELEKNNQKLDKVHMTIDGSKKEYQNSLRVLAETIDRWKKEWKEACDKFQDLEEERIGFLKSNLWAYANVVSTVCVSDDEGCENIRVALEKCDIHRDIETFVRAKGTGSAISDPPEFVNFLQGYSRESTTEAFKVANFTRRGSDIIETAQVLGPEDNDDDDVDLNMNQKTTMNPLSTAASLVNSSPSVLPQQNYPDYSISNSSIPILSPRFDETDRSAQSSPIMHNSNISPNSSVYSNSTSISSHSDMDDSNSNNIDDSQLGAKKRTWASPFRKRSKKDLSKGWNSFSPAHSFNSTTSEDDNNISNGYANSASASDLTITAKSGIGKQFVEATTPHHPQPYHSSNRASVLGMGENMFDLGVSSPSLSGGTKIDGSANSRSSSPNKKALARDDPLLAALERLKVSSVSPSPTLVNNQIQQSLPHTSSSSLVAPEPAFTAGEMNATSAKYSSQTKQLFSYNEESRQHQQQQQPQQRYRQPRSGNVQRPKSTIDLRSSQMPRATSPNPDGGPYQISTVRERPKSQYIESSEPVYNNHHQRSKSQSPTKMDYNNGSGYVDSPYRGTAASPTPYGGNNDDYHHSTSPAVSSTHYGGARSVSPAPSMHHQQQYHPQQQQVQQQTRQQQHQQQQFNGTHDFDYGYQQPQRLPSSRPRSKSSVDIRNIRQSQNYPTVTSDGRQVIRYSKAAYDYRAAIPEEVSFRKGEVLLVTRMQEDGWWEVEVMSNGRLGLAPSNFLINL